MSLYPYAKYGSYECITYQHIFTEKSSIFFTTLVVFYSAFLGNLKDPQNHSIPSQYLGYYPQ